MINEARYFDTGNGLELMMKKVIGFLFIISFILTACGPATGGEVVVTPTQPEPLVVEPEPTPIPTVEPPSIFTLCTAGLPGSLFPFEGDLSLAKSVIFGLTFPGADLQAMVENGPSVLTDLPTQQNGGIQLEPVSVTRGQPIVDARGDFRIANPGVRVRPAGCRHSECEITWDGDAPLELDQMVVRFWLREDLTWSDGIPLTAGDSTFSYELVVGQNLPGLSWGIRRTESYRALDSHTIEWQGRPGFTTAVVNQFFWTPLPAHRSDQVREWTDADETQLSDILAFSFGPYRLSEQGSDFLRFEPNPDYPPQAGGSPVLDQVIVRQVGSAESAWSDLQSGACDLLDSSFRLAGEGQIIDAIRANESFDLHVDPGKSWVQLVFSIEPVFTEGEGDAASFTRPGFFRDPQTRRGIAHCLDRDAMLARTMQGLGRVWPSFMSPNLTRLPQSDWIDHDPALGQSLFESAGWRQPGGDNSFLREAQGVAGVPDGTPFELELLASPSPFHQDLAEIIAGSLGECGIALDVTTLSAEQIYAPGPDGPLFGRQFDLALIAWQPNLGPDCAYYQSWQIPSQDNNWVGTNIAGLSELGYDQACSAALLALPEEYSDSLERTEALFLELLPAVPLVSPPDILVIPSGLHEGSEAPGLAVVFELINRDPGDNNSP